MKKPDKADIINLWLSKYYNLTCEELIQKHPKSVLMNGYWFRLYPCTTEQDKEWRKEAYSLLRKEYKLPARYIKKGWWQIEFDCAPFTKDEEYSMTREEFNNKYSDYLKEGFYGLAIDIPELTEYLDHVFRRYTSRHKKRPFQYSQIKLKFNQVRIYCTIPEEELRDLEVFCQQIVNKYITQGINKNE